MTSIRTFARFVALPIVSAGIIGGGALGLAGAANAATSPNFNAPTTHAAPSAPVAPGVQAHRAYHRG